MLRMDVHVRHSHGGLVAVATYSQARALDSVTRACLDLPTSKCDPTLGASQNDSGRALFALLAVLANAAVAVVSAQDAAVFNTSAVLLGNGISVTSDCGTSGPPSCSIDSPPQDACCYEYPGGLLLQTQFWDTHPAIGPADSWTIHGLWPDNCDGSFEHDCDPSRNYRNIGDLLDDQGASDTRSFLESYMINNKHQTEQFWEV